MKDKAIYLFDTSIWIDIERGKTSIIEKASVLIKKNAVCLTDLIIAELLRGARNQSDYDGLRLRLESFLIYKTQWSEVSELAYTVARAGYNPPLTDLYIAQCAIQNKKVLITKDRHFAEIASVRKFKMEEW